MTIKTLSAIALVSAALASPVFAQRHVRATYNAMPRQTNEGWSIDHYGWDRSRIGDEDPDLRPAAN
jgi:hypothetical protein